MDALTLHRKARLKELIDGKPYLGNQKQFADAAGLSKARITQLLDPEDPFGERAAQGLCAKLNLAERYFEDGFQQDWESAVVSTSYLESTNDYGESVIFVPLFANAGSMGVGTEIQHDDILVGKIALKEQWVTRRLSPTSSEALRFIHAYGDSMSPTFEDGDVLLVDTGMRDPRAIDGVYVMAANDRLYIKRVRQRMDKAIEISSDNPTVKTVDVLNGDHTIDILGRVVWCWNGRKL